MAEDQVTTTDPASLPVQGGLTGDLPVAAPPQPTEPEPPGWPYARGLPAWQKPHRSEPHQHEPAAQERFHLHDFAALIVIVVLAAAVIISIGYLNRPATTTSVSTAIEQWAAAGGDVHTRTVTASLNTIERGVAINDSATIRYGCRDLGMTADAAAHYGPIPDADAQRYWANALALFTRASQECMSGVDYTSASMVKQAGADVRAGKAELKLSSARMDQINQGG